AADVQQAITPLVRNTFALRLPIAPGDKIGFAASTGIGCSTNTGDPGDSYQETINPTPVDPASSVAWGAPNTSARANVEATVEPDADGDGYGDETQDQCPTDASTQGACPPAPKKDTLAPTQKLAFAKKQRLRSLAIVDNINESAAVKLIGWVNLPGASKNYGFK